MASSPRRRPGMSPTTIVLILLLLGAVAGASRLVTPTPPPPPDPKQAQAPQQPTQNMKAMEAAQRDQLKKQEYIQRHQAVAETKLPPMADPTTPIVTNDYFRNHKPGVAGEKQTDAEIAAKQAEYAKYRQMMKEAESKVSALAPKGPTSPPEPGPGVPAPAPAPKP